MERITNPKKNYCEWDYCSEQDRGECSGAQGMGCALFGLYERLKHYEDLAEQGRLVKTPCAVGDTVYEIIEDDIPFKTRYIGEYEVQDVSANAVKYCDDWNDCEGMYFSRAEAEARLAELKGTE